MMMSGYIICEKQRERLKEAHNFIKSFIEEVFNNLKKLLGCESDNILCLRDVRNIYLINVMVHEGVNC